MLRNPPDAPTADGLSVSATIADRAATQYFKRYTTLPLFNIPVKVYDFLYIPIFVEF
jgi:hypothetical protein